MKGIKTFSAIVFIVLIGTSCEKILEFEPEGSDLVESEALSTKEGVIALLNSSYSASTGYLGGQFQSFGELLGDNVDEPANNNDLDEVYRHNVLFFNSTVGGSYGVPYNAMLKLNRVLEVLDDFDFTAQEKDRITGECLFLRAMAHSELVKLFAQPPGFTASNNHLGIAYKDNTVTELLPRMPVGEVYSNIESDLMSAELLLPSSNGIYATNMAAKALLARIYFQQGKYADAAAKASEVIDGGTYSLGTEVDRFQRDVVLPEVIWYLQSYLEANGNAYFSSGGYTGYYTYRPDDGINAPTLRATREFYDLYAVDTSDKRLDLFQIVNEGELNEFIACTKFNEDFFNVPVLHLTEMKLIRAESLAKTGTNLSTAIQDINDIRERAYGGSQNNLSAGDGATAIINAAQHERRMEMFAEGDRVQQIKRRGAIEGENLLIRGDRWDCGGLILQFPISEQSEIFELNPQGC